ncbi:dual specificity protein phosphatase 10 [Hippoglossus stenolepis]|uniref:dual specificity protein phosphatase 10 n=1 Tax=Hippoglossus stenolepis TaxID=195615 RepID=UPI001FAEDEDE|nr:dual specificity protein phosphatase 10 [Hippoglossus stenolepis]XP_034999602.2 dual specificity protein phosphatase 10 [Hippoglossus stenolepis]
MPPSPLDDRIVVALPRPIRPQELQLRLDTSYLDSIASSGSSSSSSSSISSISSSSSISSISSETVISTTVVKIQATANLVTYMPSSKGSTRSLSCGCSSASCCSVTTYEKDSQSLSHSQVSASSPNLSYAGPPTSMVSNHEALSTPSLTSGTLKAVSTVRVIHPNELAKRMTCCPMGHPIGPMPVIIDCRPFMEYNKSHVRGAVHINCSDKISRRRLQQGKITVLDLISCREGKDSYKGIFSKEIVVYDESTMDPHRLTSSQPLHVVLDSLRREGKDPIILKGGLSCFRQSHENLCEHSLHLREGLDTGAAAGLTGPLPHSLPSTPDIENAELTPILPFVYLGNEHDAQDANLLQRLNIGYILNVTTHLPLYHYDTGLFVYKRLPATDSNKQNLRQYFEEAFEFIEEAHQAGMGLLIHCQAGVSRSATIVIAYLMKHTWMTMTDAYKFVKTRRPIISPNLNFMGQLLEFEEDLNNGITPRILTPKLIGVETVV